MTNESPAALRRLNQEIPAEENRGNRLFFQDRLAAAFAIRRAKGQLDNREMVLLSLTGGGTRKCDPKEAGRWKVLAWANEPVAFPGRAK